MALSIRSRVKHAWNAFFNKDPTVQYQDLGSSYSSRPDRVRLTRGNERSIITAVFNRIALDVSSIEVRHVRLDDNNRYIEDIDSSLNHCFTIEANKDQTSRAFFQDVAMSMLDEGCVALIPVDTDEEIDDEGRNTFKIITLRTGKILQWYPDHIQVRAYNDATGNKEEILLPKSSVAIVENPFYAVMNESNSTLQRLIRKLNLLDSIDEQSGSQKLDLIIQLPYQVKSEARKKQAEMRHKEIEDQLANSKYGIAYIDSTEHITQLNRAVENNLLTQVEYLTNLLFSQLGITQSILDGTADEKTMTNYYNRTVEPIMSAIVDEMKRKFLTQTARTQLQSIKFFQDPFKLVTVSDVAEIADKFTRNEIMTSNEIRQVIGMKPSSDPEADELRNKNLSKAKDDNGGDSDSMKKEIEELKEEIADG